MSNERPNNAAEQHRIDRANRLGAAADAAALTPPPPSMRQWLETMRTQPVKLTPMQEIQAKLAALRRGAISARDNRSNEKKLQRAWKRGKRAAAIYNEERAAALAEVRLITGKRIQS